MGDVLKGKGILMIVLKHKVEGGEMKKTRLEMVCDVKRGICMKRSKNPAWIRNN